MLALSGFEPATLRLACRLSDLLPTKHILYSIYLIPICFPDC